MPLFFTYVSLFGSRMTPFVSYYTSFGQPPSQASRREPWEQEWSFGPTSIKNDNLNNYGLSNKKQSTCFSFLFFLLSSTQVEIIVAFHPTIHNCLSLRAEIWSRSMFRTAKKSTDSRIFMAMRPVGPASVHKVRLLPRTLTLSFFSFPSFIALHHQSPACNSRFARASVRKMKRLRPRRQMRLRLFNMTTYQWERSSWVLKWSKTFSLS